MRLALGEVAQHLLVFNYYELPRVLPFRGWRHEGRPQDRFRLLRSKRLVRELASASPIPDKCCKTLHFYRSSRLN